MEITDDTILHLLPRIIAPISGTELLNLYKRDRYARFVSLSKVFDDPSTALKYIVEYYDDLPSIEGRNNPDITYIRDVIYSKVDPANIDLIGSLTITAPHTHWPGLEADDRYLIGPIQIQEHYEYFPVSFVWGDTVPLPYEWADSSVGIVESEWQQAYEVITKVNKILCLQNIPFGIAVDFRFRDSLFEASIPSMEFPFEKKESNYGLSYIISGLDNLPDHILLNTEQVAWHALSEQIYQFSAKEILLLNRYRKLLDDLPSLAEREVFFANLDTMEP